MLPNVGHEILEGMDIPTLAANPSWTWSHGYADPLVCAGFLPIVPGVIETWAVVSPNLRLMRCRVELIYDLYDFHLEYCKRQNIHRVQCMVDDRFPQAKTMVAHLGYRYESAMLHWGRNDEIRLRYAWFLKDHI